MCLLLSTPYQQVQHHPETILEDVAKKLRRPILHLMDPQIFGLLLNSFTQTLRSFGLPFSISSKTKVSNILLFLSGQLQLLLITSCLGPIHKWYSIFWAICWPPYQRYTYRVLQRIQMKLILLCVWAEPAVWGSTKTALKFKYKI